jgi:uncharacterized repeat protein (TIGR01451 family)
MKTKLIISILLAFFLTGAMQAAKQNAAVKKTETDTNYSWKAYPNTAKTPSDAKLLVERESPKTVRPNEEYTYVVKVTNQSYYKIDDVTITEKLPDGFKLIKATPSPEKRGNDLKWDLGVIAPDQKEIITITGKVAKVGKFYHTGNARANFNLNRMLAITEVIEPSLQIKQKSKAPENVIVGEIFPVKLFVNNIGSADVANAKMNHVFPENMTTKDGLRKVTFDLGDIGLGQSKTVDLELKALKTGLYRNKFVVVAKDGVSASTSIETYARKPNLRLRLSAPKMRFVGNVIKYSIKVSNTGDGNANNMKTTLDIPSATQFISANEGGKLDKGVIVWDTTSLEPNESKDLIARVKAKQITNVTATARTEAFAADAKKASVDTSIEGIAALLLKVDDINDPVPVGETETYVVKVTNQGSLPATNIRISCDLEDSMKFVKSSGPTKGAIAGAEGEGAAILMHKAGKAVKAVKASDGELKKGKILVFEPLSSLAPGKEAVWQIVIKALKPGDFRFNVNVISEQLTRPVNENESTTFYKD